MSGFEWLPTALSVGSTILKMGAADEASETAGQNAAYARGVGEIQSRLDVTGAGLNAFNVRRAAARRKAAADLEADVLETQAGQVVAAAQREAIDVRRVGKLAESRAIALAAASGGGVSTSSTVGNIIGNLARESAYNAGRALYAGEEKSRMMKMQSLVRRAEGDFAVIAGEESAAMEEFGGQSKAIMAKLRGGAAAAGYEAEASAAQTSKFGTLLSGAGSLFEKYGKGWLSGGSMESGGGSPDLNVYEFQL